MITVAAGALTLPHAIRAAALAVLVVTTAIWVGGLVAIFVVARVAQRTLTAEHRVALFRALGRVYGLVGGSALVLALASGGALAATRPWNGQLTAGATLAGCLAVVTAVGVVQARRMTRLRRAALQHPGDDWLAARVRRGARCAAALRAAIAALSLALVALGAVIAA